MVSLRVYDADDNQIAVENGTMVELKGYEEGQREVMKAVLATADSKVEDCAIVASEEVMYDERKKNLDEFVNEAGAICRGYIPRSRNIYSITKEGFVGATAPTEVGAEVGLGADGKLDAAGTGYGTVMAIEIAGRYTYYVIKIA
ncbi:MAG: hypothetical protein IJN78_04180 [Clostridia bacterium]|nr:hypothetical protein [Clostridia bacterium]